MADEIMTFDEILADPTYKAEFDRRITKALSTVQSKLDAEVEKNKQFAANGSAETEALKKEIEGYKSKIADYDYADVIRKTLAEKGVKFSSKAAEKAYLADLKAKHLEIKDGALDGFDEWHKVRRCWRRRKENRYQCRDEQFDPRRTQVTKRRLQHGKY